MMNAAGLHVAVHEALTTDPMLVDQVAGRVFDQPPQDVEFPYLSYGPSITTPNEADCFKGEDVSFQIDVWSRRSSRGEAAVIGGAVVAALHRKSLTITGGNVVFVRSTFSQILKDPDGRTFHGVLRFEAMTEVN